MKQLLLAAAAALAASAGFAQAAPIVTFGSTSNTNNITATENAAHTQTTIAGTAPVSITQIITGAATPAAATLVVNATSTDAAMMAGAQIVQSYSGTFSITDGATNYLSGSFTDALFGSGTGLTI